MASAVVMPRLSDTMTEGKIVAWRKKEGEPVKSGDALADVETDKAVLELEAYEDGTLLKIVVAEGQSAPLGATVAVIGEPGEDIAALLGPAPKVQAKEPKAQEAPATPAAPARPEPPAAPARQGRVKASPLARRIARESGVDLGGVSGTGPSGRIVARDIQPAAAAPETAAPPAPAPRAPPPSAAPSAPPPSPHAEGPSFLAFPSPPPAGLQELNPMRKTIAARTGEAWRDMPHFYLTVDVDMEACSALREELASLGAKVSINDFVIKAAAIGLRKVPEANRSFEGGAFRQHGTVDVSMAVSLPDGLVVPILHGVDRRSVREISAMARDLAERARAKQLRPEEYEGGSVTVSNLGMFGIDSFHAVLNVPQAMILAVGRVAPRPVVHEGRIEARRRMSMSLSADHRTIDGALGARYLSAVREALERPVALMA